MATLLATVAPLQVGFPENAIPHAVGNRSAACPLPSLANVPPPMPGSEDQGDGASLSRSAVTLRPTDMVRSTDPQYLCVWSALTSFERLDRYERRVITRRRRAIWEFCK